MAQVELPAAAEVIVKHEIQGLIVRPGDTVLLCCKSLPDGFADLVHRQMREQLPDVKVIVVQAEAMAVYRPEGT